MAKTSVYIPAHTFLELNLSQFELTAKDKSFVFYTHNISETNKLKAEQILSRSAGPQHLQSTPHPHPTTHYRLD
jgi:hypothetical protein